MSENSVERSGNINEDNKQNIPELRFHEFKENWQICRIKDICNVKGRIGFRGYKTSDLVEKGKGALTIGGKHITNNHIDLSDPEYLSWEKFYESPEIEIKIGDIILAQRGSLGVSAIVEQDIGPATINPSMVLLKNIEINNKFLFHELTTSHLVKEIITRSSSTAVPMISQKDIKNIKIKLPSEKEQEKISEFLSSVDKKIELMEKKYTSLINYHKSITYTLINNFKLNEENQKISLNQILNYTSSSLSLNNLEENDGIYPLFGADGFVKNINFYEMNEDYIGIVKDGAGVGRITYNNKNTSILGTMGYLTPKTNINLKYVYYYLSNINLNKYIVGSTIPHIYFKDYSKELIYVPKLKEQEQTVELLDSISTIITKLNNEMKIFKNFKKSLLSKMFC